MNFLFKIFKKKEPQSAGLVKAWDLKLITEEEFLELTKNRAEKKLAEFLKAEKKK